MLSLIELLEEARFRLEALETAENLALLEEGGATPEQVTEYRDRLRAKIARIEAALEREQADLWRCLTCGKGLSGCRCTRSVIPLTFGRGRIIEGKNGFVDRAW